MKWIKVLGLLMVLAVGQRAQAQNEATVTWTTTRQTIEGFGASDYQGSQTFLTTAQKNFLFSTNGIGLSILRIGSTEDGSCTSINASCAYNQSNTWGWSGSNMSDAQFCVANGCRVYVSSFTPPAIWKTNYNPSNQYGANACKFGTGNGALATSHYADFATYLSNFIASMQQYNSVSVYAISPQNEPDTCVSYSSALWTGAQLDTFVRTNLGPTLAANGQGSVKIIMPESNGWYDFTTYADPCMNDSACKAFVSGAAYHAYDPSQPTYSNPYSVPLWMTETSDAPSYGIETCPGYVWCPGIGDALTWAYNIHLNMVAGTAAWFWWNTQQSCSGNPWQCNSGLYGSDGTTIATRAYAIGNWSKFVRPGWVRIDATANPQTDVYVTSFKNASTGAFAIVALNQNKSDTVQTFSLSGFTATSITPYITSNSLTLEEQSTVTAGSSFSYTLPAQSISTFVGTTNGSSTGTSVAPPTNLTLVIH